MEKNEVTLNIAAEICFRNNPKGRSLVSNLGGDSDYFYAVPILNWQSPEERYLQATASTHPVTTPFDETGRWTAEEIREGYVALFRTRLGIEKGEKLPPGFEESVENQVRMYSKKIGTSRTLQVEWE